jgi:DNA-binding NarL/FixJ family response regulator
MLSLSVALVSRAGSRPISSPMIATRLIREPSEIRPNDDVVLFYGTGMAQKLRRFSVETGGELPPTAVLARWLDWDDVNLALDHGAVSYLLENQDAQLLAAALAGTSRRDTFLAPEIAAEQVRLASRAREHQRTPAKTEAAAEPDRLRRLSRRERQIMEMLAAGLRVRDVAHQMFLTEKTVRNYLSSIYGKLNVHSQSEAILCWLGHLDPLRVNIQARL